ncbi:hypothetical protein LIER_04989 [Lithospermum erythrorhizon]|uniref:Uncharacterized protein n=1 Tax=Lithospermum erythrorhizon TaxID=34254 RepID=A0AAV3P2W5_LITER
MLLHSCPVTWKATRPDWEQLFFYDDHISRSVLHSCPMTWKASRPDREQLFFYDNSVSQPPSDRARFVSACTGRVCHRVGLEFVVEPYNPYRFSRQFGYIPTIRGLSSSTREMVDLATGLSFWRSYISSRARQTVIFPGNTTPRSPPGSYKTWLNKLFPFEAPRSFSTKHGKGKGLLTSAHPSTLVFKSYGSSKRKCSSSRIVQDRDPKHARGAWKDTSSSRGSRVVVEVSSCVSDREHIELVDTGKSPKCLTTAVAESCPPALPTLTIAQRAEAILRARASSI